MEYSSYTTEDFLKDSLFLKWVKDGNQEARDFWERWLNSDPENKGSFLAAKYIAQNLQPSTEYRTTQKEYISMYEAIFKEGSQHNYQNKSRIDRRKYIIRVAAVIIPLIFVGYLFYSQISLKENTSPLEAENVLQERYYPKGKKSSLTLSDKTKVNLNSESSFRFPGKFLADSPREVYLEGEAFFDVAEDLDRPFLVHTGAVTTKVLGTSFNVEALQGSNTIKITVATGKVSVYDDMGNKVMLSPNETMNYDKETGEIKKVKCQDMEMVTGWKDGKLLFRNADFSKVFDELEKWYGVEIILETNIKINGTYSGRFQNESLKRVLEGISYTSDFQFDIKGDSVYINNR